MAAVAGAVVGLPPTAEGTPVAPKAGATVPLPPRWMKVHRMRAYDSTLGREVYWDSGIVDTAGNDYGGPGPLQGVVCSKIFHGLYEG